MILASPLGVPPPSPVVSVVIPTIGRPALLTRAVASVLAQTLGALDAIVVIGAPARGLGDADPPGQARGRAHPDRARAAGRPPRRARPPEPEPALSLAAVARLARRAGRPHHPAGLQRFLPHHPGAPARALRPV